VGLRPWFGLWPKGHSPDEGHSPVTFLSAPAGRSPASHRGGGAAKSSCKPSVNGSCKPSREEQLQAERERQLQPEP
jgi:hypothetical protein